MEMAKMCIFHHMIDVNNLPAYERWMQRYHLPEVLTQYPWMVRYLLYRCLPGPEDPDRFGYTNYRIHENWALDNMWRRGEKGLLGMTARPAGMADHPIKRNTIVHVPAEPTEDFFGSDAKYDDHTIFRWYVCFRYPDGVSQEEGEDWYLNVHVPEMLKTPGITRYFSHKAFDHQPPLPQGASFNKKDEWEARVKAPKWNRLTEIWFEDYNSWKNGIIDNPPKLTPPPGATVDKYPFLQPYSEIVSTFLLESPDHDFCREKVASYF